MPSNHSIAPNNKKSRDSAGPIRQCAEKILDQIRNGTSIDVSEYPAKIQGAAYKLLRFENLIRTMSSYKLTQHGEAHVRKHGSIIYPKVYDP